MIKMIVTVRGGCISMISSNYPELVTVIIDDKDENDIGPALVCEFDEKDDRNFDALMESIDINI